MQKSDQVVENRSRTAVRDWLGRWRSRVALALALLALSLAMWIVVPAPTRLLLPLAVGAPELCGVLVVHSLLATAVALFDAQVRRASRWALLFALVALIVAKLPLVRFGPVARDARAQLDKLPVDHTVPFMERAQAQPLNLTRLFRPAAPDSARIERGIEFASPAGEALTMDVYRPPLPVAAGESLPVIVQVYGGAWQRGDPSDFSEFARYFASRGYVVFAIDYRHAPQHVFPAQSDDVRSALAFIGSNAGRFNADTSRMVLIGRSAGAQLALLAAYAPGAPHVRGVISYYGPVDLVEGYNAPPLPDPLDVRDVEEKFLGGTPASQSARYRDASPITYAHTRQPPTLLVYGGRDHIVEARFGRMLRDALAKTGTTVVHLELPWAEHAFDAIPNGPSGQLSRYTTERFIAWAVR